METITTLILSLIGLIMILVSLLWVNKKELAVLRELHQDLTFTHQSKIVKHGKSFEQFFPFMHHYPYNPSNFRFLGSPIDGVSFEDDHVAFIEFKTGTSKLTKKQQHIKDLITNKKIVWKEIRD